MRQCMDVLRRLPDSESPAVRVNAQADARVSRRIAARGYAKLITDVAIKPEISTGHPLQKTNAGDSD